MPWDSRDALRHTKKADTKEKQSAWSKIANAVLRKTGDEASAVRIANAQIKRGVRVGKSKMKA